MSVAPFISAFCCDRLPRQILWCILMLIGPVVQIRANPPRAMLCFSVTTSSPGPPSVRTLFPDPAPRPSIAPWLMVSLRPHGCANGYMSFTHLFAELHWCIVTTSAPSTYPPTRFSISELSILRLISTSSGNESPLVIFVFFMCLPLRSMQTSSPKGSPLLCSRSSGTV